MRKLSSFKLHVQFQTKGATMKLMAALFTGFLFLHAASATVVKTTHGLVEGTTKNVWNGKIVEEFLGIPYADKPTGENRFASPQPLPPWEGTLKASTLPGSCRQAVNDDLRKNVDFVATSSENEDCLYLNLWVPRSNKTTSEPKPIMIWIHGGGYFAGSSNIAEYDGSTMASEHDVIVASMNYRLTMFGFLFLNDSRAAGNQGLQDQIEAIKWIHKNAKVFGGDPARITIFGQSVGSVSVSSHLTNKDAQEYFNQAIMESGHPSLVTLTKAEALDYTMALVRNLKCSDKDVGEILKCIRGKSADEILSNYPGNNMYLRLPFAPVRNGLEVPLNVETAARDVPANKRKNIISGNIPKEMGFFISAFISKPFDEDFTASEDELRDVFENNYEVYDRTLQNVMIHEDRCFKSTYNASQVRIETSEIITDTYMLCPQINFTEEWVTGENRVYYYSFNHRPSRPIKSPVPEWQGVAHGDDNPFVFGLPRNPSNKYTEEENKLSETIMTYWANFVKTGNPNEGSDLTNWPALKPKGNLTYMEFDLESNVNTFLRERQCTFWRDLYPTFRKK